MERLDKQIARTGVGRAEARRIIAAGRVTVDGRTVRDAGAKAESGRIALDGAPLDAEKEVYLMVHKPAGMVTATEDPRWPTVTSLVPERYARRKLGPVGRLDRDVTGLVILTTDGELAHRLISPKRKAEKVYRAVCRGRLDAQDVARFAEGVVLSDCVARPAKLRILETDDDRSTAEATLTEGKFHQVKRMFEAIGHPLERLSRIRIGCVTLDVDEGQCRPLRSDEVEGLKRLAGQIDERPDE